MILYHTCLTKVNNVQCFIHLLISDNDEYYYKHYITWETTNMEEL